MLYFVLIFISFAFLHAEDANDPPTADPIVNLEGEPSDFVRGCVNALTGDYSENIVDMVLPGVEPFALQRTFHHSSKDEDGPLGLRWNLCFDVKLEMCCYDTKHDHINRAKLHQNGGQIEFDYNTKVTKRVNPYSVIKKMFKKGVTNTGSGLISGRTNLKNMKLVWEGNSGLWQTRDGAGTIKTFIRKNDDFMPIISEQRIAGNQIKYYYRANDELESARFMNSVGKQMASYQFHKRKNLIEVITFDQRSIFYQMKDDRIKKVIWPGGQWEEYSYDHGKLTHKKRDNNRYLEISYKKDESKGRRVSELFEPVGHDETPILTYRFHYNDSHRYTTVYDAVRNKTIYKYEKDHRLRCIDRYGQDRDIYLRDRLYWNGHELAARAIEPHAQYAMAAMTYEYDEQGNVRFARLYGNLTGNNKVDPKLDEDGKIVSNECECYVKNFQYSDDGLNLVKFESDGVQAVSYEYFPGNDMVKAKFYWGHNRIYKREFFDYNSDLAVTKHTIDDGTTQNEHDLQSVTHRFITYYKPRIAFPVGLPEEVMEKCLDVNTGSEKLIHKIVNHYSSEGHLIKQEHYDSFENYAYSLFWQYDKSGNVIKETNALNQSIVREYDANNNLYIQQGINPDLRHRYTYDCMNRLVMEEAIHSDGQTHCTHHKYDLLSNRISTIDPYGNETLFSYDAHRRLIEITKPGCQDEAGNFQRSVHKRQYDHANNLALSIDPRGFQTAIQYTIRGKPYLASHSDGTIERTIYNIDGTVRTKVNRDGTYETLEYDFANRPIKKILYDREGNFLEQTSCVYGTFHLLSETDPAGRTTYYSYTPEGRLFKKIIGCEETTHFYDSLGREAKVIKAYGDAPEEVIVEAKEYDLLDRVIEERTEDYQGYVLSKVNYVYDATGNKTQTIKYLADLKQTSVTTILYSSHGDPVLIIDPEGNRTKTTRNFSYRNELGNHVPYVETLDPRGNVTCTTYDALGRIAKVTKKDPFGIVSEQETRYDAAGNLIAHINLNKGQKLTTFYRYDSQNQLTALVEAYGLAEQRTSSWKYNHSGKKSHHIKPDGTTLYYSYNPKGELVAYHSSDKSIDYSYEYDLAHNPVLIRDLIHNTCTQKIYDIDGRLTQETLGNGLAISYTYDRASRPSTVTLPDNTAISYSYYANQLKKVSYDKYTHQYLSYDLSGHPTSMQLIKKGGNVDFAYDVQGRKIKTTHSKWSESLDVFDANGNLVQKTLSDSSKPIISQFSYDALDQLATEDGIVSHSYVYDNLGNCVLKDGNAQEFNLFNMQLNDDRCLFSYDTNGNLTDRPPETFQYDALNRLIDHQKGFEKTSYTYDSQNRRLSKTSYVKNGEAWRVTSTDYFIYQAQNEIGTCNANHEITELRILGIGRECEADATVALKVKGKFYAPIHDHTGSIACLIDPESGKVSESYRYTAFGEPAFDDAKSPWLFSGKRFDKETGFFYFGQRYYDPKTARWISIDPIGTEDGPNLYAYVHNRPLICFDQYGLFMMRQDLLYNDSYELQGEPDRAYFNIPYSFNPVRSFFTRIDLLSNRFANNFGFDQRLNHSSTFERLFCYESENITYGDKILEGGDVGFINGINYDRAGCEEAVKHISDLCGGVRVQGVFNPSTNFVFDLARAGYENYYHLDSPAVRALHANWNESLKRNGPNSIYLQYCTSEGSILVNNAFWGLSEELRKRIMVVAISPSRFIKDKFCENAYHYISMRDPVCLVGMKDYNYCSNVIFLTPDKKAPFFDHKFISPTFSDPIKNSYYLFEKLVTSNRK